MPFVRRLLLFLATAYVSKVFANVDYNNAALYPPGTFDNLDPKIFENPALYGGNGQHTGHEQSNPVDDPPPVAAPIVQNKYVVADDEESHPSPTSPSATPSATASEGTTDYVGQDTTGQDTTGNGHGDDDGDDSGDTGDQDAGQDCPPGCTMKIRFTKQSKAVDFAVNPRNMMTGVDAVVKPMKGRTKDTCICVESGGPRVNIGTNNIAHHTTLVEVSTDTMGWYDVSFVEGFSLPVVCWSGEGSSKTMSGYNKDLFAGKHECGKDFESTIKQSSGDSVRNCENTKLKALARDENNPDPMKRTNCWKCTNPSPFFAPAAGAAYTYPFDDAIKPSGPQKDNYRSPMATGKDLQCCVGTDCPSNTFSAGGSTSLGNCEKPKDVCEPCQDGNPKSASYNDQPTCNNSHPQRKRDVQSIFEDVAEKRKARKRHLHHQYYGAHGST